MIVLIRHAKVDYAWRKRYRPADFDKACAEYNVSPIIQPNLCCESFSPDIIYVSGLRRTHRTAEVLFPGSAYVPDALFDEVEITSFTKLPIPLHVNTWFMLGRLQWIVNAGQQKESRKETLLRAEKAANLLIKHDGDIAVVSHGLFLRVLVSVLKKKGYSVEGRVHYHNLSEIRLHEKARFIANNK